MSPLIDCQKLQSLSEVQILDCRFDLADPAAGRAQYEQAHLPGAVYADLDRDLADLEAGPGRHPLPSDEQFSAVIAAWGLDPEKPVVVYDSGNAAMAARAWWLLSATGFRCAALDGGMQAWIDAGLELDDKAPARQHRIGRFSIDRSQVTNADQLSAELAAGKIMLVDARARERFAGEVEPIDSVAGHVPGSTNRPFTDNLEAGRFKSPEVLSSEWRELLKEHEPEQVVHMCGSGVTACTNLLAMAIAGLSGSRLYADSWSGWIAEGRPVASGT